MTMVRMIIKKKKGEEEKGEKKRKALREWKRIAQSKKR